MRLCSHVVTTDVGLAPNPYHGYRTSALCTPSHRNARLKEGEWLIGHSRKNEGNRLVYAMRISDVLTMNQYFYDDRFQQKKPRPYGTPEEQCGDNIYYQNDANEWKRLPSRFHNECHDFRKDVGHRVFVAEHFYYFGDRRVPIPDEFASVIQRVRGIHYTEDPLAAKCVSWLEANYKPGILGTPRDMADRSRKTG